MSPSVTASAVRSTSLRGFRADEIVSQILRPERINSSAPNPPPMIPYWASNALFALVGNATTRDPGIVVRGTATMRQPLMPESSATSPSSFASNGIPWVCKT